mmetsp:Transcript_62082/g.74701  ORF Transcript_62082/g.74701 Transcript_62082/m.74701 type:complete len:374 (+) Transcript_62082:57-1178(+)
MRTVGYIGICLTGSLWLVTSWRLAAHSLGCSWSNETGAQRPRAEGVTMRRAFHGLLWLAMLSEAMAYIDLAFGPTTDDDEMHDTEFLDERTSYVLLSVLGRAIFEFSAFSLVAVVWFKSTADSRAGMSETHMIYSMCPIMLIISGFCLGGLAIWETVDLLFFNDWNLEQFKADSNVHIARTFFEAVTWGSLGVLVICNEIMIYTRLSKVASWYRLDWKQKLPVLYRALGSMSVCSLCFLLRSSLLFVNFSSLLHTEKDFESGNVWWICMVWIPTIIPSVLLLHALRKVDRAPAAIEGMSDALLLQRQPPEAAFQGFRSMMDNDSVCSSLVRTDSLRSKDSSRSSTTASLNIPPQSPQRFRIEETSDEESVVFT